MLYEMSLDGKLLRQFTTAQQSVGTSHDIAIDCDNHRLRPGGIGGGQPQSVRVCCPTARSCARTPGGAGDRDGDRSAGQGQDAVHGEFRGRSDRVRVSTRARAIPATAPCRGWCGRCATAPKSRTSSSPTARIASIGRCTEPTRRSLSTRATSRRFLLSLPGKGGTLWLGIVDDRRAGCDSTGGRSSRPLRRQMAVRRRPDRDTLSGRRACVTKSPTRSWDRVG